MFLVFVYVVVLFCHSALLLSHSISFLVFFVFFINFVLVLFFSPLVEYFIFTFCFVLFVAANS